MTTEKEIFDEFKEKLAKGEQSVGQIIHGIAHKLNLEFHQVIMALTGHFHSQANLTKVDVVHTEIPAQAPIPEDTTGGSAA